MKKTIVVYKSSTGFTKRYAQMIAQETHCAIADFQKLRDGRQLAGYDTVIFGSRAHAGSIDGLKKMRKLFQASGAKRLLLFVTGAMPDTATETIQQFWSQNLTADELLHIPHFYMPGGLCYEKMSRGDRLMMKAAAVMMKRKKHKSAADLEFERAIAHSYDISDRKYMEPLVSFLSNSSAIVQEMCEVENRPLF